MLFMWSFKTGKAHSKVSKYLNFKFLDALHQVFAMFNDIVYAVGAYFLYVEWKTNPTGAGTASPVPPPI